MARVVLDRIFKTFSGPKKERIDAVKDVSLTVGDRELLVLVGPSGSGKSTLLRLIAGLEKSSSGSITMDSAPVDDLAPEDRDIAMVFQSFALYPHMTVRENLAFPLKVRKFSKSETEVRVREAAEMLGLVPYFDRLPKALSGGERQRVALGRAIVRRPKVFLFDEPLSNLDARMRVEMRMEIARLHKQLEATMIYVTHDQVEAMTLGHRVAVLDRGAIRQIDQPLVLYRRPANLFVAGFIGSPPINLFPGKVVETEGTLHFHTDPASQSGFTVPLPSGRSSGLCDLRQRAVLLGLRPEHIREVPPLSVRGGESLNTFEARIELVEPLGAETHLHVRIGSARLVARVPSDTKASAGGSTFLAFDLQNVHLFDPATSLALV
jgi:multiple sugar transport system ATP-binding protein